MHHQNLFAVHVLAEKAPSPSSPRPPPRPVPAPPPVSACAPQVRLCCSISSASFEADEGGHLYALYTVDACSSDGRMHWMVRRRFSEFVALRDHLCETLGKDAADLGALPPHRMWGEGTSARVVEERCAGLGGWLEDALTSWQFNSVLLTFIGADEAYADYDATWPRSGIQATAPAASTACAGARREAADPITPAVEIDAPSISHPIYLGARPGGFHATPFHTPPQCGRPISPVSPDSVLEHPERTFSPEAHSVVPSSPSSSSSSSSCSSPIITTGPALEFHILLPITRPKTKSGDALPAKLPSRPAAQKRAAAATKANIADTHTDVLAGTQAAAAAAAADTHCLIAAAAADVEAPPCLIASPTYALAANTLSTLVHDLLAPSCPLGLVRRFVEHACAGRFPPTLMVCACVYLERLAAKLPKSKLLREYEGGDEAARRGGESSDTQDVEGAAWHGDAWQVATLALICLASKMHSDVFESHTFLHGWGASVRAGWPLGSLRSLGVAERALLQMLEYRGVVYPAEFARRARADSSRADSLLRDEIDAVFKTASCARRLSW